MRKMLLVLSAFTLLNPCGLVQAQTVAQGTPKFGTYSSGPDVINIGSLNVHFSIPILTKPGRAGMNFNYALTYDSSVWAPVSVNGSKLWQPVQNFGWSGLNENTTGYAMVTEYNGTVSYPVNNYPPIYYSTCNYTIYNFNSYIDIAGTAHPIGNSTISSNCPSGYGPQARSTFTQLSSDGSGITLQVTNYTATSVSFSNGTNIAVVPFLTSNPTVTTASTATDSNGNEITVDSSGHYTDTTGRVALTVAGSSPNPMTFTYTDTSGNPQRVTVNYRLYSVQTSFGCSGVGEYNQQVYLVDNIVLADGTSTYRFSYEPTPSNSNNVTGRLAGITLPTGGTIGYQYSGGTSGIECSDGSTAGLTRTLSGDSGSAASTWTYARSFPNGAGTSHTDVVDGLGNHSAYDFMITSISGSQQGAEAVEAFYETQRQIFQGAASGTPLLSRLTCYNGAALPCTTTSVSLPITSVDTYETLNGIVTDGGTATYDGYGNLTGRTVYDFGSGSSRGGKLMSESLAYGYAIPGLQTLDTVYDGSGTVAAKTEYDYDQTTPTGSSGVPQHTSVTGTRGNVTTIKRFSSTSTSLNQSFTYEDTGSVLSSRDSQTGAVTTFSYDPTFVYNQGVNYPTPSSGVPLSTSMSYDTLYSGLPKRYLDFNSQPYAVQSYDSSLRPTEIDYPDSGRTLLGYTANSTTVQRLQQGSTYSETEAELDGYGRKSRVFVANGQSGSGWYQQDECYDANGNPGFVSYNYQGSGTGSAKQCSGSGDTYTYDVLGRLTRIAHADGTTQNFSYYGRAWQITDENAVKRITQVDGLGRASVICEISSNGSMPGSGSPVNCGTDIAGTGFTTNYSYSLANGTTTIMQGGQTRTFQSDWLGRTTSVTEPERGTTTYSYAFNSTGLQVTRQRPQANQSNPSTLTTTTTQYDVLGRPISITYSDSTPTKTFSYDISNPWGASLQNTKGRLAYAGISNAQSIYSYDAVGRVIWTGQCDPSNCGSSNYATSYSYDYAGNLLTSTDGSGTTDTYAYSLANEIQSVTSSWNDSNHPPDLLSNVQNGPFGPVNWHLGNGLNGVRTYDSMGRNSGGWVCNGSTSANCTGGSLVYGYTLGWSGSRVTSECDTALNQCMGFGYDEFNRIASRTINSGTVQNFTYVYDRWGNRWQQNVTAGISGPSPQLSFNTSTNQISTAGYAYDAAGNLTRDGIHTYTYDADGNVTKVDNGSTATYTYSALNQRVRMDFGGSSQEFIFNPAGQHTSTMDVVNHWEEEGKAYWGGSPLAVYTGGTTQFEHQDWLGTERMRTNVSGNIAGSYISLPFGDGYTVSGNDWDAYHFAGMDQDTSSNDHAQFRGYSNMAGRWMSPDPYNGSYDISNPQSMNRYSYVLNMPLSYVDPLGLDFCQWADGTVDDEPSNGGDTRSQCLAAGGVWETLADQQQVFVGGTFGSGGSWIGLFGLNSTPNNGRTNWPPTDFKPLFCTGDALAANGVSLALDAVGFFLPAKGAAGAVAITVSGVASAFNSLYHQDGVGAAAGVAGESVGLTYGGALAIGASWAGVLPGVSTVLNVGTSVRDVISTGKSYNNCMKSSKYD